MNGQNDELTDSQYWAIVIPVILISSLILLIIAWVGFTMIMTKEPMKLTYDSAYEEAAGELEKNSNEST